tara:strand:+ start:139 stop:240 length:102 start_codon:yes stop_codon:yes gene_type:complete
MIANTQAKEVDRPFLKKMAFCCSVIDSRIENKT